MHTLSIYWARAWVLLFPYSCPTWITKCLCCILCNWIGWERSQLRQNHLCRTACTSIWGAGLFSSRKELWLILLHSTCWGNIKILPRRCLRVYRVRCLNSKLTYGCHSIRRSSKSVQFLSRLFSIVQKILVVLQIWVTVIMKSFVFLSHSVNDFQIRSFHSFDTSCVCLVVKRAFLN
jgi:hypothetical protein